MSPTREAQRNSARSCLPITNGSASSPKQRTSGKNETTGGQMKYGRFEQQGRVFFGTVEGDTVNELEGSIFDNAKATAKRHKLSEVKILAPCVPANFYCAGLNY